MIKFAGAVYDDHRRRANIRDDATLNGIDYLEVVTIPKPLNQRVLHVYFIPPSGSDNTKLENMLADLAGNASYFTIIGGQRIQNIRVISVERVNDHLAVVVNTPGDFSEYTLAINHPGLDIFYRQVRFNFKAGCPSRFDCNPNLTCPPEPAQVPFIDYMAKDYASFRQVLIDLIPKLIPAWTERQAASLELTLLELLAYVGDQLSYYQDAVANEAYLETARQRVSVRRYARLIDYRMHDGLSARAIIHFALKPGTGLTLTGGHQPNNWPGPKQDRVIRLLTRPRGLRLTGGPVIAPELESQALAAADSIFEIRLKKQQAANNDAPTALHLHANLNQHPHLGQRGMLPARRGHFCGFNRRFKV